MWRGTCSCGEWVSRWRETRNLVEREAFWHDDCPEGDHVVRICSYAEYKTKTGADGGRCGRRWWSRVFLNGN